MMSHDKLGIKRIEIYYFNDTEKIDWLTDCERVYDDNNKVSVLI